MKKLAIIIPAYKPRLLQETLDSIAKQNNHEFTVYIGDDASPYPLESIVDRYKNKFDIIYHRFEQNMGKKDLPGHWERCILLSAEELIWLFSDDDLMPFDGVARIIRASQKHSEGKYIFRFPLEVVDDGSKREDLLNSLWLCAPMMQHGLNLQNLQEESYLYQAILSAGEMLKERIYQTPLISIKKRLEQQYFSWNGLV